MIDSGMVIENEANENVIQAGLSAGHMLRCHGTMEGNIPQMRIEVIQHPR